MGLGFIALSLGNDGQPSFPPELKAESVAVPLVEGLAGWPLLSGDLPFTQLLVLRPHVIILACGCTSSIWLSPPRAASVSPKGAVC